MGLAHNEEVGMMGKRANNTRVAVSRKMEGSGKRESGTSELFTWVVALTCMKLGY